MARTTLTVTHSSLWRDCARILLDILIGIVTLLALAVCGVVTVGFVLDFLMQH